MIMTACSDVLCENAMDIYYPAKNICPYATYVAHIHTKEGKG